MVRKWIDVVNCGLVYPWNLPAAFGMSAPPRKPGQFALGSPCSPDCAKLTSLPRPVECWPHGKLNNVEWNQGVYPLNGYRPWLLMGTGIWSMGINGNQWVYHIHELCMIFPLIIMSSKIQTRSKPKPFGSVVDLFWTTLDDQMTGSVSTKKKDNRQALIQVM